MTLEKHWPVAGLRIRTPLLELRYPSDDDLVALAELAIGGIHDPGFMPFLHPWTDAPADEIGPNLLRYFWGLRAAATPDNWSLPLVVLREGRVVGIQDVVAERFRVLREVTTGSWLGRDHQGRGTGTEMRSAALHFVFDGLGAQEARSAAVRGNAASLRVSAKLGYAEDGIARVAPRGEVAIEQRLRLTREAWQLRRRDDIVIGGLAECRAFFGLG